MGRHLLAMQSDMKDMQSSLQRFWVVSSRPNVSRGEIALFLEEVDITLGVEPTSIRLDREEIERRLNVLKDHTGLTNS